MPRADEVGFENLGWEDWNAVTGLPREAFEEWLALDAETRRDVVGIFLSPDELEAIRGVRQN